MAGTLDVLPQANPALVHRRYQDRWKGPLLTLVALELVVLFAPTVAWLLDRWTMSVWHNAHGIFVPPLSAWLAWQALRDQRDVRAESSGWGFVFLIPALMLHALDAGMHSQLLSAVALFTAVPGIALLLLGPARARLIAFPMAFLFFSLPIPLAFTESLHLLLRHLVANSTAAALPWFGVSVYLEGTTLHTTTGILEIIDACSGFSTLTASVTLACLLAYMATSWRTRLTVLLSAVPVAIAANVVRVIGLALMIEWLGGWVLDSFLHPLSGMMAFAMALPVLFWLGEPSKGGESALISA